MEVLSTPTTMTSQMSPQDMQRLQYITEENLRVQNELREMFQNLATAPQTTSPQPTASHTTSPQRVQPTAPQTTSSQRAQPTAPQLPMPRYVQITAQQPVRARIIRHHQPWYETIRDRLQRPRYGETIAQRLQYQQPVPRSFSLVERRHGVSRRGHAAHRRNPELFQAALLVMSMMTPQLHDWLHEL